MRSFFISLIALICVSRLSTEIQAVPNYQFVVVVNQRNPITELTESKLKTIFLRQISRWPWGAEIRAVELPEASTIRREFVKYVLGSTSAELAIYWIDQKTTRNIGPPDVAPNAEAIKTIVSAQAGAIGYIPASALDGTVKRLEIVR